MFDLVDVDKVTMLSSDVNNALADTGVLNSTVSHCGFVIGKIKISNVVVANFKATITAYNSIANLRMKTRT
jgi:hypothetical protein